MSDEKIKNDEEKEEAQPEEPVELPSEEINNNSENNSKSQQNTTLHSVYDLETLFIKGLLIQNNDNTAQKISSHMLTSRELELAELRVKVICQEKNNMALKLELKCAELQVESKEKVDQKKTRLIELLDSKVASLEKKNNTLIEMVETLIKEKETRSSRLIDATKNMQNLSDRLEKSEQIKRELKSNNTELKEMLGSVEEKGSKIAKLAKEKLTKYRDENLRIQGELNDMNQQYKDDQESLLLLPWLKHFERIFELLKNIENFIEVSRASDSKVKPEIFDSLFNNGKNIEQIIHQIKLDSSSTFTKVILTNKKLVSYILQLKPGLENLKEEFHSKFAENNQLLEDSTQLSIFGNQVKVTINNLMEIIEKSVHI